MRQGALPAGLLAAGLLMSACGPSPTTAADQSRAESNPYAPYQNLTGRERAEKLLADAREEGGVLDLYTSNTDIQDLVDGFEEAHPGIEVRAFRANSETVLQRTLQENQAGKPGNDVVDTNDLELRALDSQHLLRAYTGPSLDGLKPEAKGLGNWTAERFNAFVAGWNTREVSEDEPPADFTGFADPKWKGRLSVEVGDWDWYASMYTYLTEKKGMSRTAVDGLFEKIVANVKVAKGHTVQGEMLSAGQFGVALSVYSHTVDKAARKGAPVAWKPAVEPVILRPNGIGLMAAPRHPAAALLWTDYVLGPGQKEIAKSLRIPAARHVPGYDEPVPPGTETFTLSKTGGTETKKWDAAYDALLRGAPQAG
ncbi:MULTISPECIES: extracellular solute-binding protein [Streptomyces]|uniref:ABC transporter substrate-binding protein n=1 Tax=Streptomyces tendae TaxID=1932 RepID=A0A6B3Q971_STRTE|nr:MULTISPECIES: ABC transporter substrate-binding protein [Streptomyces]MBQ0964947.1 ABC transporter substrate-binding protein [Streptomyces sp. RK74B]MBQ1006177.1 ABC transporter substrate-binding protein [Streptomyces sp. RK23]NEV85109.1 ABC transporter substrate-binding protein [Streptomyces tendae]